MRIIAALTLLTACTGGPTPTTPTPEPATATVDADLDGFPSGVDCNDADATVHPGAAESCDGIDQDCDGEADNGLVFADWYPDVDGDGFGDADADAITSCEPQAGAVEDATDCDDGDAAVNPGRAETCDGRDEDCDGAPDNGLIFVDRYPDLDGDGFGDAEATPTAACSALAGRVDDNTDCDDAAAAVNPAAAETCDGVDDNCDGTPDDGLTFVDTFVDADADGFGTGPAVSSCAPEADRVLVPGDCDDVDADRNPGAVETCNELDDNCDGAIDEGVRLTFAVDLDLDGFETDVEACVDPDGLTGGTPGDCDDANPDAHPGRTEICDGADNDCDGGPIEHAVPTEFSTVQAAVDAALSGDVVCLLPGVHVGSTVVDKDLRFEGTGADEVFLDGDGAGRVIDFDMGAVDISLEGLTIQNGLASEGAGLRVRDPLASIDLVGVSLLDNRCETSPCLGVGANLTGGVTLDDVLVSRNLATIPDAGNLVGVGMYVDTGTLTGTDVRFIDNIGTSAGSIWIAGAAFYTVGVDLTLVDSAVIGNSLVGGQTRGHAFATDIGSVLLERVVIQDNSAFGDTWPYPAKGAIHVGSPFTMRNGLVVGNHSEGHVGGNVLGNAFTTYGLNDIVVEHSTIADNTAPGAWSSLFDANNDNLFLSNLIVSNNDGGSLIRNNTGTQIINHTLVHTSGFLPAEVASGVANQADVDPLFDSLSVDYSLAAGSPAIDAGDPSVLDGDGSVCDLGYTGGPYAD